MGPMLRNGHASVMRGRSFPIVGMRNLMNDFYLGNIHFDEFNNDHDHPDFNSEQELMDYLAQQDYELSKKPIGLLALSTLPVSKFKAV